MISAPSFGQSLSTAPRTVTAAGQCGDGTLTTRSALQRSPDLPLPLYEGCPMVWTTFTSPTMPPAPAIRAATRPRSPFGPMAVTRANVNVSGPITVARTK